MSASSKTARPFGRTLNVLYVDDHRALADLVKLVLSQAGHAVEIAEDGFKAWERISEKPHYFHVLITDHRMPGFSGLELMEIVRQSEFRGRTVVYSGVLTAEDIEAYHALEVDEIIPKATAAAGLLSVIGKFANEEAPHADSP